MAKNLLAVSGEREVCTVKTTIGNAIIKLNQNVEIVVIETETLKFH